MRHVGDVPAAAVVSLLVAYPNGWSGTSADLLASLEQYRPAERADIWPPNAQSLSRRIEEVLPQRVAHRAPATAKVRRATVSANALDRRGTAEARPAPPR